MHGAQDYLSGLAQLGELSQAEERRAVWRQGIAALANAADDERPTPLEGVAPETLLAGVRVALASGLVDDLDWLSQPVAAAALVRAGLGAAGRPGEARDWPARAAGAARR